MLGKQWLNKYDSIDLRGSAIERSQDRQRKLNGIDTWYFDQVIGSLPVMLQAALLLLGCALSKYLWEVDTTVAAVVVGVTSFGVLFYLFVVVAAAASVDCPYQTPLSKPIRGLVYTLFGRHSAFHRWCSFRYNDIRYASGWKKIYYTLIFPPLLLTALIVNILKPLLWTPIKFACRVHTWWLGGSHVPARVFDSRVTKLDCHCVSWILRTSSDITIKEFAVNFLGTIVPPPHSNSSVKSAILVSSFDAFNSCVGGNKNTTSAKIWFEQLAGKSAVCLLRAYASVVTTEPTSAVIDDVRIRYKSVFPNCISLYPYKSPVVHAVHGVLNWGSMVIGFEWECYNPPVDELISVSRAIAQVVQFNCRTGASSFPDWLVQFAFRFLSRKQPPPTSVVVSCLMLIATNLECNIPDAESLVLGVESVVSDAESMVLSVESVVSDAESLVLDAESVIWDAQNVVQSASAMERVELYVCTSKMTTFLITAHQSPAGTTFQLDNSKIRGNCFTGFTWWRRHSRIPITCFPM